jgi:hypothetical protein
LEEIGFTKDDLYTQKDKKTNRKGAQDRSEATWNNRPKRSCLLYIKVEFIDVRISIQIPDIEETNQMKINNNRN